MPNLVPTLGQGMRIKYSCVGAGARAPGKGSLALKAVVMLCAMVHAVCTGYVF